LKGDKFFITATDTGAGKTYVTTALICALRDAGKDIIALKPVACGNRGNVINPDVAALLKAQGLPEREAEKINLYSFDAALAPSQAAAEEGRKIAPKELINWCSEQSKGHDICLIEGVGGLMAPLTEGFLVANWLARMPNYNVMLVVRSRLGGINHALLTLDKLNQIGRPPCRIIINDADNAGQGMLDRHAEAMAPFLAPAQLGLMESLKHNHVLSNAG